MRRSCPGRDRQTGRLPDRSSFLQSANVRSSWSSLSCAAAIRRRCSDRDRRSRAIPGIRKVPPFKGNSSPGPGRPGKFLHQVQSEPCTGVAPTGVRARRALQDAQRDPRRCRHVVRPTRRWFLSALCGRLEGAPLSRGRPFGYFPGGPRRRWSPKRTGRGRWMSTREKAREGGVSHGGG